MIGFRGSELHHGKTWTKTYWVVPDSKLPVEIWTELRNGTQLEQRWVTNHFVYDRDLADELFSTKTPADYSSEEGEIHGLRAD